MICCVCEGPTDGICSDCINSAIKKSFKELMAKNITETQAREIWDIIYANLGPWYYEWY